MKYCLPLRRMGECTRLVFFFLATLSYTGASTKKTNKQQQQQQKPEKTWF
jgi:hypothetical protein